METATIRFESVLPGNPYPTMDSVIVKLQTDNGISGIGEGVANFRFGETNAHILTGLSKYWEALKGEDPFKIADIHEKMDRLSRNMSRKAANTAIDLALYDIMGKATNNPVYEFLGGGYRTDVDLLAHIFYQHSRNTVVKDQIAKGYRSVEVKCDPRLHDIDGPRREILKNEAEELKKVLEVVDDSIPVIVDFNQAFRSVKALIGFLRPFEGFPNLLVEQPFHFHNLNGLAKATRNLDLPIIADESVLSPESVLMIARLEAADMVNIKLTRVGGIYKAIKVMTIAEAAGLGVRFDCTPNSKMIDTATCHVAVNARDVFPCSVDSHLWFKQQPVKGGFNMSSSKATILPTPGQGVEIDDATVASMRIDI